MSKPGMLREKLSSGGLLIAPGAYDGLTATLIGQAGFEAVYMTGAGTAGSLGYPDFGLVTMTEMVQNAARINACVDVPVIADADTGYGNELNVVRTVQEFERAGVAAIHIEDQEFPKKCGHLDDKQVIELDDYLSKIRAAADARKNPDFTIIARTDARAVIGFEEAVARANAALEAGADVAFVEAPQTMEEVRAVPKLVQGPCLLNVVHRGKTPEVDLGEAEAMGYRIAILPTLLFRSVIGLCEELLRELKEKNAFPEPPGDLSPHEAFRRFGSDEWDRLRDKFNRRPPREAAE
ncbi:MAG: carboxyvinyl-carboxyphosphonate phosphorylmutase [Alphaproteobacteria bacterium]|nr:MAG: carboxyvinyl-carboxyphosphonate phosphorylmutase [Alphaproteobacteria bacterium]